MKPEPGTKNIQPAPMVRCVRKPHYGEDSVEAAQERVAAARYLQFVAMALPDPCGYRTATSELVSAQAHLEALLRRCA